MKHSFGQACVAVALFVLAGPVAAQWKYATDTDQMSGNKVVSASVDSTDSLRLQSPYAGANKGRLIVRNHPRHGLDVLFLVQKGQIMCRRSSCEVLVRFDEEEPETFPGSPSADHSSNVVFIGNQERFIELARNAKRIRVQVAYFQNGLQILNFQAPKGLDWK
jgi:hypothetical protein